MSRVSLDLIFMYECSPPGVSFSRSLTGFSGNEVAVLSVINIYGGVCIMKSEIVFVLTVFSDILESELGNCMCFVFCVNEREV